MELCNFIIFQRRCSFFADTLVHLAILMRAIIEIVLGVNAVIENAESLLRLHENWPLSIGVLGPRVGADEVSSTFASANGNTLILKLFYQ